MGIDLYKEATAVWKMIARDGDETDFNMELEIHRKLLNIFQVGEFYYFIFNVKKSVFQFISPDIERLLGYPPAEMSIELFLSRIHPDDQVWFIRFEKKLHDFFRTLSLDIISQYKVRYDFRIRHRNGNYIRILHQLVILKHDEAGNLLFSLGIHTDISDLKKSGLPALSFIGLNGVRSYINIDVNSNVLLEKPILTTREREVLLLLANGLQSKEVAVLLNIAKQTVDFHRKNMLQKTGLLNTTQLAAHAIRCGWI